MVASVWPIWWRTSRGGIIARHMRCLWNAVSMITTTPTFQKCYSGDLEQFCRPFLTRQTDTWANGLHENFQTIYRQIPKFFGPSNVYVSAASVCVSMKSVVVRMLSFHLGRGNPTLANKRAETFCDGRNPLKLCRLSSALYLLFNSIIQDDAITHKVQCVRKDCTVLSSQSAIGRSLTAFW